MQMEVFVSHSQPTQLGFEVLPFPELLHGPEVALASKAIARSASHRKRGDYRGRLLPSYDTAADGGPLSGHETNKLAAFITKL